MDEIENRHGESLSPVSTPNADLLTLLDAIGQAVPAVDDQDDETRTVTDRFLDYHRSNPNVYKALVYYAREFIRQTGRQRIGINLLVGKVRYETAIRVKSADFRINNVYAPYYARLIAANEPDLGDVFEQRRSVADSDGWLEAAA